MKGSSGATAMLGVCAAILAITALHYARPILAPVAFAFFIIAIVWPLQNALRKRMPNLLALALTLLATAIVLASLGAMVIWGFGQAGHWIVGNAARFQSIYTGLSDWLEQHDIYVANLIAEHFDVGWVIGLVREISVRLQTMTSFSVVALVFTMLGLLEVDLARRKLENAANAELGGALLAAASRTAARFQRYMLVRSLMSVITGQFVWGFAAFAGLELAIAWGVIAFALNYIPFVGPLVATILPTLFAIVQFESWQMAVFVFLSLNLVQFLIGSYVEPRIAGATVSLSPFIVLFAVFFWSFIWGLPGALIGVPIMIALHTLCELCASGAWIAAVLSDSSDRKEQT